MNLELSADGAPTVTFTTPGDELTGDDGYGQAVMGRQGRLMRMAGWIDVESRLTVDFHTSRT